MDLCEIIEECLNYEKFPQTTLAIELKNAQDLLKRKRLKNTQVVKELDKLSLKMMALKDAESSGDLCWLEKSSWKMFTKKIRNDFIALIDPFIFSNIYFIYSRFEENFKNIDFLDHSIYLFKDRNNYKVISYNPSMLKPIDLKPTNLMFLRKLL